MTWKCSNCNIVLGDVELTCPCCGRAKLVLNKEEREAWEAFCASYSDLPSARAFPGREQTPESVRFAVNFWANVLAAEKQLS